ncbi:MAG TPA: 50S ribosomal protein L18 [Bacteroidetes bacterium]|nr:50S ribosomal protein L18 [Bacteroidota bacterium]
MKKATSIKVKRRKRIHWSIRKKVKGTVERPRLSVYKSNKGVFAQLIDDVNNRTLVESSYRDKEITKGTKTEMAKQVGQKLGEKAKAMNIDSIVFDRSGYKYHGIVKALAEGARESGLKF